MEEASFLSEASVLFSEYGPVAVPMTLLVLATALSWVLRLPFWLTAVVLAAPLLVVPDGLPFTPEFVDANPLIAVFIPWGIAAGILVAIAMARVLAPAFGAGSNVFSLFFSLVLAAGLVLVSLLLFAPDVLETHAPDWRSSYGLFVVCVGLFAFTLAVARVLKASLLAIAWGAVLAVVGAEVWLDSVPEGWLLPHLRDIRQYLPDYQVQEFLPPEPSSEHATRILLLREQLAGEDTGYGQQLAAQIEQALWEGRSDDERPEVFVAEATGAGIAQMPSLLERAIDRVKPQVVVFGSWFSDALRGENSYGLPGLSESEAARTVARRKYIAKIPGLAQIFESRLLQWISGAEVLQNSSDAPFRTDPGEYQEHARAMLALAKRHGAHVLLVPDPAAPYSEVQGGEQFRAALEAIAREERAFFLNAEAELRSLRHDLLFETPSSLSIRGRRLLGRRIAETISKLANPEEGTARRGLTLVLPTRDLGDEILMSARVQNPGGYYRFLFGVNDRFMADRKLDHDGNVRVRFPVPADVRSSAPYVKLRLERSVVTPPETAVIANGQFRLNGSLAIESRLDGSSSVELRGRPQLENAKAAWVLFEIDRELMTAVSREWFEGTEEGTARLAASIRRQPWGTLLALVKNSPVLVSSELEETLKRAFAYVGIHGVPSEDEAFAAVGVTGQGSEARTRVAKGESPQLLSVGSDRGASLPFTPLTIVSGAQVLWQHPAISKGAPEAPSSQDGAVAALEEPPAES